MNIQSFIQTKLFPLLGKMVRDNIVEQIDSDLFSKTPFGFPLADETIDRKARKGGGDTALFDTGKFKRGVHYEIKGDSVQISSNGRTKRLQSFFVLGTANIPERNPFVKDLPLAHGTGTIERAVILKSDIAIIRYVDKQISALKGVT